ncbi:MAG: hypothetical protein GDA35_10780 [Hyphomonadaceae bacterium]|nr:hypothetical protein [Hyphomonadaceae bacterium]
MSDRNVRSSAPNTRSPAPETTQPPKSRRIGINSPQFSRSRVRACVEHPFADQKHRMGLTIRTMGLARATIKIAMSNIAHNLRRLICHKTQRGKCA